MVLLRAATAADLSAPESDDVLDTTVAAFSDAEPLHWLIAVPAVQAELSVDVPDELASGNDMTLRDFAARVAALPKVTDSYWTYRRLGVLADAMRGADTMAGDAN